MYPWVVYTPEYSIIRKHPEKLFLKIFYCLQFFENQGINRQCRVSHSISGRCYQWYSTNVLDGSRHLFDEIICWLWLALDFGRREIKVHGGPCRRPP